MKNNFKCAYDKIVEIHTIVPNPKNPNKHPEKQIDLLSKIIDHQGQRSPIVVSNRSGFIIKGHARLEALKKLNWDTAAVDYQDYESEAEEYADMVADNKIAELAEHDDPFMIETLKEIKFDLDLDLLGMEDFKLEFGEDENSEDEKLDDSDEIDSAKESRCSFNQVWKLGNHILYCGDSLSEDFNKFVSQYKIDMIYTDPPYGIDVKTDWSSSFLSSSTVEKRKVFFDNYNKKHQTSNNHRKVVNDDIKININFLFQIAPIVYVWGGDYFLRSIPEDIYKNSSLLVWDKNGAHEDLDRVIGSSFETCLVWPKRKRNIIYVTWRGFLGRTNTAVKHPTEKPAKLHKKIFEVHKINPDITILDPFAGIGSTIMSCEATDRRCISVEIDPEYCDIIIEKWESYTKLKAELVND